MRNFLSLAVTVLVAGLSAGCSKKVDLRAATAIKSGVTYTLDGRSMSGTAKVVLRPASTSGAASQDSLYVHTYAQTPMGAEEYVHLTFTKAPGQADIDYKLVSIYISVASAGSYYFDSPHAATLTHTAPDRWAGTFAGTRLGAQGSPVSQVADGVFTQIAP